MTVSPNLGNVAGSPAAIIIPRPYTKRLSSNTACWPQRRQENALDRRQRVRVYLECPSRGNGRRPHKRPPPCNVLVGFQIWFLPTPVIAVKRWRVSLAQNQGTKSLDMTCS